MKTAVISSLLALALFAGGCSSPTSPSAGAPKQLQGDRIPKGAGPDAKR
jgi:hypothetical protein